MDKHDDELEIFLRQFQLRKSDEVPDILSPRRRGQWALVAAAVVVIVGLSALVVTKLVNPAVTMATVEEPGNSRYQAGARINEGEYVVSANNMVLTLEDGSEIEMASETGLHLESLGNNGVRVRLKDGRIILKQAKARAGNMVVQTNDAVVTLTGTVLLVEAEEAGTGIFVLEGEGEVRFGSTPRLLKMGEGMATNSAMAWGPIDSELSWSRNASALMAMLQPAAAMGQFAPRLEIAPIQPAPAITVAPIQSPPSMAPPDLSELTDYVEKFRENKQQKQKAAPPIEGPAVPREFPSQPFTGSSGEILNQACGTCHSPWVAWKHYPTREEAEAIISREKMKGATISPEDASALADYLFRFGGTK